MYSYSHGMLTDLHAYTLYVRVCILNLVFLCSEYIVRTQTHVYSVSTCTRKPVVILRRPLSPRPAGEGGEGAAAGAAEHLAAAARDGEAEHSHC